MSATRWDSGLDGHETELSATRWDSKFPLDGHETMAWDYMDEHPLGPVVFEDPPSHQSFDEMLRRYFIIGFVRAAIKVIKKMAADECPQGCNAIDPVTLEFVHATTECNFSGIAAYMKFGDCALMNHDDVINEAIREAMEHSISLLYTDFAKYIATADPFNKIKDDPGWIADKYYVLYECS